MPPPVVEPSDPRDLLRLLRRRGWILLLCVIAIPAAVYLYTERLTKTYASTVIVSPQATTDPQAILSGGGGAAPGNVASVASIAETSTVRAGAARIAHEPIGSIRYVTATSDEDTGFVTIEVGGTTPARAQRNAQAVAAALGATRKKQASKQIADAIASVQAQLARPETTAAQRTALRDQLQRLQTIRGAQGQTLAMVQLPDPGSLVAPLPRRNALIALIAALLIGVGLMVLVDRFDRRIRKPEELEALAELPLLGTIPSEAFPGGESGSQVSEAFQTVRDSLTYFNVDGELSMLMVISPVKGDGKTTVATNLAMSIARSGRKVILVDADLRHPQVASRLGVNGSTGLSDVLAGAPLAQALQEVELFGEGGTSSRLWVLPAGRVPPNPSELIGSSRMESVLAELSEQADVVVIDTTPLLVVSDAFPLIDRVSGTVAIARLERTSRDAVRRMLSITATARGRVLGVVATGAERTFGYGYGYGYETRADGAQAGQVNGQPPPTRAEADKPPGRRLARKFRSR
jgi:tyrosine-protein kinase